MNPESCSEGLVVPPSRGDMLIFYNAVEVDEADKTAEDQKAVQTADHEARVESAGGASAGREAGAVRYVLDERARHAACPLSEGEKFIANVWLHPRPEDEAMLTCAQELEGAPHAACMSREARAR